MITRSRTEMLDALERMGASVCAYSMPGRGWAKTCDCKYGADSLLRRGEENGCPELRLMKLALSRMTDEQWEEIVERRDKPFQENLTFLAAANKELLASQERLAAEIERLKADHKFEYDACEVARQENKQLRELLNSSMEAIQQLEKAVENLLPGARHIVANVGLINDALCGASDLRQEITKVLEDS